MAIGKAAAGSLEGFESLRSTYAITTSDLQKFGLSNLVLAIAILAAIVMGAGGSERQQEMNLAGGILPYVLAQILRANV